MSVMADMTMGSGFQLGEASSCLKQLGGIGLGHDFGFEIEAAAEAEVFVVGPGEAVDAAVFAAAIGVEGPVEGDVGGRGDAVDDGLGAIEEDLAFDAGGGAVGVLVFDGLAVDLFAEDVEAEGFEAIAGVEAAPRRWAGPVGRASRKLKSSSISI